MDDLPNRILLVDDDQAVRAVLRHILQNAGYCVLEAGDGAEAVEMFAAAAADVLLLDLRMPRMDGLQALGKIRAISPDTPVIVVSGAGDRRDVVEALRLGAFDFLIKPLEDMEILRHAVRRAMERVQFQRERQAYQQRLEQEVQQRTAELRKAVAAKDEFLAMVSHELRTPLNPALLALSAMRDDPRVPQLYRGFVAMACQNIELEARLIDDLLDLSQIMSRKFALRLGDCDVHIAINAALELCRGAMDEKKLSVLVRLDADNHMVWGDGGRLGQVFWHLLANAVKFTAAGGSVTISTENQPEEGTQSLVMQVRDTGIGMDPKSLDRAFRAFEQTDQPTTRQFGGLGIGLAIAKAIVEMHGGTVQATIEGPGTGATFTVRLPVLPISNTTFLAVDRTVR